MNAKIVVALVLALPLMAQAEVYTWTDEQGVRHYSDSASGSGAQRADLPGIQSADGNPQALEQLRAKRNADNPGAMSGSRLPQITSPEAEATIPPDQEFVPVAVTIGGESNLRSGETLVYYLDGAAIPNMPTDQTRIRLGNVSPGMHSISVALMYEGNEVRRTSPQGFTVAPPSPEAELNRALGGDSASNSSTPSTASGTAGDSPENRAPSSSSSNGRSSMRQNSGSDSARTRPPA